MTDPRKESGSPETPLLPHLIEDAVRRFRTQTEFTEPSGTTSGYGITHSASDAVDGLMQQSRLSGSDIFNRLRRETTLKPREVYHLDEATRSDNWNEMLTEMARDIVAGELHRIPEIAQEDDRRRE